MFSDTAFAAAHKALLNSDPGLYGPEAYDAATILLKAVAAGNYTRAEIAEFVAAHDDEGFTKHIRFTQTGEVEGDAVYSHQVKDGAIVSLGIIK